MPTAEDLRKKLDDKASSRDQGRTAEKCPKKNPPVLFVMVADKVTFDPISGAEVDIGYAKQTSGGDGIATFDPAKPANTTVVRTKLTEKQLEKYLPVPSEEVSVPPGTSTTKLVWATPLPTLSVKVVQRGNPSRVFTNAKVKVTAGPQFGGTEKPTNTTGIADFGQAKRGGYSIQITSLDAADKDKFKVPEQPYKFSFGPEGPNPYIAYVDEIRILAKLRVVLVDKEDKPISGKEWELVSPNAGSGTTAANGLIEVNALDFKKGSGVLKVKMGLPPPNPPPPSSPPVTPPTDPPPYPAPIKAEDYKDKAPDPPVADADDTVEWALTLSLPDEFQDDPSVKSRLQNLGFTCVRDSDDTVTTRAVKQYQRNRLKQDAPTGGLGDIKGSLTGFHDNP